MKSYFLTTLLTLCCFNTFSTALKGTKTINANSTAPNNYTSLRLAINDLNTQGVDSGGVVFEFAENHVEYAGNSPYIISASGSENSPIVFRAKNPMRKPTIYAHSGNKQNNENTIDGIVVVLASDYLTFDGLILKELASNTNTFLQMEFGFGFFVIDSMDGAQHNTVKNCEIQLQRIFNPILKAYTPSGNNGILFINSTYNNVQKSIVAYTDKGTNSYNEIIANKISNCANGISLIGTAKANNPAKNQYNKIGGSSGKESNSIEFFGTEFSYTTINAAIYLEDEYNTTIGSNAIKTNNSSDKEIGNMLYGIYLHQRINTPNYTNIHNNLISITTEYACKELAAVFIENAYDVNVEKNSIKDLNQYVKNTGSLYGIFSNSTNSLRVSDNKIINLGYNTSVNAKAEGILEGVYSAGNKKVEVLNNEFANVIFSSKAKGTFNLINTSNDSVVTISNNKTKNIRAVNENRYYLNLNYINCKSEYAFINYNSFRDDTTNIVYGRHIKMINVNASKKAVITYNTISDFKFKAAQFYGIFNFNVGGNLELHHNQVHSIIGGLESARPLLIKSENAMVYNNKIHSIILDGRTYCLISGIEIDSTKTLELFNNSISNFHIPNSYAPTSTNILPIVGINIFTATTKSKHKVYNNTIYFNTTSTSAYFNPICFNQVDYIYENKGGLALHNNLFVNTSIPRGAGLTLIMNRSTVQYFYNVISNNNLFYTGVQTFNRAIYKYGKTVCYNLPQYKALAAPNDNRSLVGKVEFVDSSFINTHLKEGVFSLAESNGTLINNNMFDIDNEPRIDFANSKYNSGKYADIGADEFDGKDLKPFGNTRLPNAIIDSVSPSLNNCQVENYLFRIKTNHEYPLTNCKLNYRSQADSTYQFTNLIKNNNYLYANLSSRYQHNTYYYFSIEDSIGNVLNTPEYSLSGINTIIEVNTNDSIYTIGDTLLVNAYLKNTCTIGTYDSTVKPDFTSSIYSRFAESNNSLFIIKADELAAQNYLPGEINSITFYIKNKGNYVWNDLHNFKISMANTKEAEITDRNKFNTTDVFNAETYTPKNGANKHTFQQAFIWDGVSNLLVKVCYTNQTRNEHAAPEEIELALTKGPNGSAASSYRYSEPDSICNTNYYRENISNKRPFVLLEGNNTKQAITWENDTSLHVLSQSNNTLKAVVKNSGALNITLQTASTNCEITKTHTVTAYPNPYVELGNNKVLCFDDSILFDARNINCTYKWYRNNSLVSTSKLFTVYSEGLYKLVVTNTNGVVAQDSVLISNATELNIINESVYVCYGESALLDAGAGGVAYLWSTGDTSRVIEVYLEGYYEVMVISPDGCIQKGFAGVHIYELPSNNIRIENLGNKTYQFTSFANESSHLFHWDFGDPSTDSDTANTNIATYTYANEGAYYISIKVLDKYTKCKNGIAYTLDVKVGISVNKNIANASVSPNPVNNETNLHLTTLENYSIINVDLFDLTGRRIKSYAKDKLLNSGENTIHLSGIETLDSSVYILRVLVNNEVLNFQLVK